MRLPRFYVRLRGESLTMGKRVLFCTRCGQGIEVEREVPAVCPNPDCRSSSWRSAPNPSTDYKLTAKDRIFLKVNRILPD